MKRSLLLYAIALAAGAFLLEWLDYRTAVRTLRTELYVGLVALGFTGLGIWLGVALNRRREKPLRERNRAAAAALGITEREYHVLELLARGCSNKELARRLGISPNTVKTHVARLYEKLEVDRRVQAVDVARRLGLIS
ncbi:MAG: response regulator transcription factor [Woeseiaceae bacterium]|nr:response regulator transcription factor [Woeseiaceae bacterium]